VPVVEPAEGEPGGGEPAPPGPDPDPDAAEPHPAGSDDGEQRPLPCGAAAVHVTTPDYWHPVGDHT